MDTFVKKWGLIIFWLICHIFPFIGGERCKFDRSWKGRWYQDGVGFFEIRSRSMDGKGACNQIYRQYYIVKNREEDCLRCLLILERHKNILQYRESYCRPQNLSPKEICQDIKAETRMYTIVREHAPAVMCPFTEAYFFRYDATAGDYGACEESSLSYAKPCVGSDKYQLHFQNCDKQAKYHDQEFSLQCIAVWKEGSETFMYGQMYSEQVGEPFYRCFKYELYSETDVYMTMSFDTSCRGLISAREGSFKMHFQQDVLGWPEARCEFPVWLQGLPWRDVDLSSVFQLSGHSYSLYVFSPGGRSTEMISEHRCYDLVKEKEQAVVLMTFTITRCNSTYKCVKIKMIEKLAMYLQIGDVATDAHGHHCQSGVQYTENSLIMDKCFRHKDKTSGSQSSSKGNKKYENEVIKNSDVSHRSVNSPARDSRIKYTAAAVEHSPAHSAGRSVESGGAVQDNNPSASVENPSISFVEELDYNNFQSNQRRHLADEMGTSGAESVTLKGYIVLTAVSVALLTTCSDLVACL